MPEIWRHPTHATGGIRLIAEKIGVIDPASYRQFGVMLGEDFYKFTKECLTMLCKTSCGDTILSFLSSANVTITMFAVDGNSVQYPGEGQNSVSAVIWGNGGNWAPVQLAFLKMRMTIGFSLDPGYQGLAHVINTQPDWDLTSRQPPAFPMGNRLRAIQRSRNFHLHPMTDTMLRTWITTGQPPALNADQLMAAKKGLSTALEPFSVPGNAVNSASAIFYTNLGTYTDRSPAVGLGHELIHAYFALKGLQPGQMFGIDPKGAVALNEYKCVGLGPWDGAPISENALRSQWGKVVFWNRFRMTKQNRKTPGKRTYYD